MLVADELAGIQRGVDELLPPGWRAEILGDRLVVNPPSGYEHNRLADRVQRLFLSRLPDHLDATVLGLPFGRLGARWPSTYALMTSSGAPPQDTTQ